MSRIQTEGATTTLAIGQTPRDHFPIPVQPAVLLRLPAVDRLPPGDQIAVRHHDARHRNRKTAIAQLVQVKQSGFSSLTSAVRYAEESLKILLAFLHPVQAERGGTVFQAMQVIHPRSLLGQGNFAEADQGDAQSRD